MSDVGGYDPADVIDHDKSEKRKQPDIRSAEEECANRRDTCA